MIKAASAASTNNALCQPMLSIRIPDSGRNRNWPSDPDAVPTPKASERLSSGMILPSTEKMMPNAVAPTATPSISPEGSTSIVPLSA